MGACNPNDGECSNCAPSVFGGREYWICQGQSTVPQADNFCAAVGMQVALINDLAENNWVVDTALAAFGFVNFEETSYWIANTKSNPGIVPPPWATSEPNNPNDECVHILRYGSQPYQWNDAGCTDWTWGWVCETAGPTCPPNCPF